MGEQIQGLKELCRNAFRTVAGAAIFDPAPGVMIRHGMAYGIEIHGQAVMLEMGIDFHGRDA